MREVRRMVPAMRERATEYDRTGDFPAEDFRRLRELGMPGLMVPTRLGGLGADFRTYVEVAYQLGRGNGATGLIFNMHAGVTGALATIPDELAEELGASDYPAHRDRILAEAAAGALFAVAMSERGSGSRLSRMTSGYRRTDDGFHLTAAKSFVSGAGHADAYLVAARDLSAPETVSQFLVPAGDGVTVDPTWDTMGMRATGSHDVRFDVKLPETALVGGVEGVTLLAAQLAPHWMVASYAAVYIGVARSAVEIAAEQAAERNLAGLAPVRARLGRADAAVSAAYATLLHTAALVDAGDPEAAAWVWRTKLSAGDTAAAVTASMMEVAGASSIRRGNPLERLFRDARCGALQPATSDVCADWLGVHAMGGDPYAGSEPRW
ncbi:alkylation response protein AidB-like acyl-CoA dehydrogenase [Stackebrandtia albiflava]|uniref:Alkylation response protein AidB-like acyl-CoA dehydrogenase n=1 Tax=Stackebrandtia albiflava TaxID=406432 RepID=A0A562V197_9ACTN|nr:acyl-CoA dehydrogenase family protein [Stackebrandtia albiflava]TWJ11577.1 alkylation response protein AidB-like acyl-CoA dehydrogenase [Stackebrandtia albiflava]